MKRLLLLILFGFTLTVFAQVSKQDFETVFSQFKYEKMENMAINNIHVYLNDGTSKWTWYQFKVSETSIELKDLTFIVKGYTDDTKTTLQNYFLFPYANVASMLASPEGITIHLKQ
jgi:hypothetical protein